MMATKVFSVLAAHGPELFAANIDRLHASARTLADILRSRPNFELALMPQTNIVCFRYLGIGRPTGDRSQLNARLRELLIKQGKYYIVQTSLRGETWLRITVTNPFTTEVELTGMLDAIEALAAAKPVSP